MDTLKEIEIKEEQLNNEDITINTLQKKLYEEDLLEEISQEELLEIKIRQKQVEQNPIKFGKKISNRRTEFRLTQEELCSGLCNVRTMSRIECGKNSPSLYVLDAILERLGLSAKEYYALLLSENFEIEELRFKIINANTKKDFTKSKKLIEKLKLMKNSDHHIIKQFIMRTETIINPEKFTPEERLDNLMETLQLTLKNFDINNFAGRFLSREEIKTLANMASSYFDMGKIDVAIDILQQLLVSIDKHDFDTEDHANSVVLITTNLSKYLCLDDDLNEALKISQRGIDASINYGKTGLLGELMTSKAYCLCKQGNRLEGEALYRDAICIMRVMRKYKNVERTIKSVKEMFDIDLSNC